MKGIKFLTPQELKGSRAFFDLKLPHFFSWFLWGVLICVIVAFIWAGLGEMEVVVKAQTYLRPLQNVSVIKSALSARVDAKLFQQGQKVLRGDLLYTLAASDLIVQKSNLEQQLARSRADLRTRQSLTVFLESEMKILPQDDEQAQRLAVMIQAEKIRLTVLMDQARRNFSNEKKLPAAAQAASRLQDLESQATLTENQVATYQASERQKNHEVTAALLLDIENLQSRLATLEIQVSSAKVAAPIDGSVEEIKRFNPGDFLVSGEEVVRIVPDRANDLKAELTVASSDIPELKIGMTFRLLFPKLPPSDYGQLAGMLTNVPEDAWLSPSGPPFFQVDGSLSRNWMASQRGEKINLKAGMIAEARIIIKKKPIWRFILEKLDFL